MSDGERKFKEMGENLKAGVSKKEETQVARVGAEEINSAIATLSSLGEDTMAFFKKNAQVGTENLGGSIPQLKITEGTSNNVGSNGDLVAPGNFYYGPTKEVFKEVEVSIVTISRGFYAMDQNKIPKPKFTQLVGGVMTDTLKPFVMFVSGTRLNALWAFGKEITPFTRNRDFPVPMMAFRVKLSLTRVTNDAGQPSHIVNYDLVRDENQKITITQDIDSLKFFEKALTEFEDTFESFISKKEVTKDGKPMTDGYRGEAEIVDTSEVEDVFVTPAPSKPVDDDGIPF